MSWNTCWFVSHTCIAVLLRLIFKCSFFLSVLHAEVGESGVGNSFLCLFWVSAYKNLHFSCRKASSEGSACSSTDWKLFCQNLSNISLHADIFTVARYVAVSLKITVEKSSPISLHYLMEILGCQRRAWSFAAAVLLSWNGVLETNDLSRQNALTKVELKAILVKKQEDKG